MYDKLYNLAEKIDSISYEYDYYEYFDTIGIGQEEREENVRGIYHTLEAGVTDMYKDFYNEIIDDIEGELLKQVQEVLKELKGME